MHPNFKLNRSQFTEEDLVEVAISFIKEGEPFEKAIGDFICDWFSKNDFVEVQTSGSTGKPKTIRIEKRFMVNSALATGSFFNLNAGDTALLCLPAEFIAGKMMLVRAMVLGLHLDFVSPSSSPLQENKSDYDFCAMVPLQVENSIENLHRLNKLIIGGAPISNSLKNKLGNLETKFFETYGMTETITHIAAKRLNDEFFKVLPGVSVSIDDRGCLVINAPIISKTEVVTNDLVTVDSESSFKWLGRFDNIINSGGVKLIPEVIEKKLSSEIKGRFFVSGVPDHTLGEKLILVVEGQEVPKLKEALSTLPSLKRFELPKSIHFIPYFKETGSGKINRTKTLELL
ncbi:AMP-binding protein [Croceivirga thetidis]|nr:AMP-binding protein [Croceivirga thetidis]